VTVFALYLADLSHRRTQSHGIVNYALGLAAALPPLLDADERLVLLVNDELGPALVPDSGTQVELVQLGPAPRGGRRVLSDHVLALAHARRRGAAVVHFPKGFIPLANPTGARLVATIHDDIPLQYREGAWGDEHRGLQNRYFAWALGHAARRADSVLTVSRFTRSQLSRRWRGLEASVTGQGVTLPHVDFVPLRRRAPYVVHFGSLLPHKRSAEALRSSLAFMDAHPDAGVDEVRVVGRAPDIGRHDHRVRPVPGPVPNAEVARLVAGARALVFSSAYEGFGLPPVEATLLGTPVVHARIPAVAEVMGPDAGGAYDAGDDDGFDAAMRWALQLDDGSLRAAGRDMAARHRWEDAAAATLTVYRRLGVRA
jgi:glycosyltransferase involved in cell wall biosynthesis